MRTISHWAAVLLALPLAAGCQTEQTTKPGAVGVDRNQTMMLSSEDMNRSAESAYKKVLAQAQQKGQLNTDRQKVERVRRIAQQLIPKTGAFRPDAPRWAWEVNVITNPQANAWCMPGGKIAVYTGLINKLQMTDDEIAAVMGHEMAHALREHARERASRQAVQGIGLGVLGAITGQPAIADMSQMVLDMTLNLPNSREHESEADRVGVELAARGGFDPRAAVSVWEKMSKRGGGQPPEFLSTHPSHEHRLQELREYSAKVMPLYQQADARGASGRALDEERDRPRRKNRKRDN